MQDERQSIYGALDKFFEESLYPAIVNQHEHQVRSIAAAKGVFYEPILAKTKQLQTKVEMMIKFESMNALVKEETNLSREIKAISEKTMPQSEQEDPEFGIGWLQV